MFLRCCAEEAHEHRHLRMSYGHVCNPRQLIPGQDRTGQQQGQAKVEYYTLPCEDMPLRCGPSSAVTVSSTTMRNGRACDSGLPLVPPSVSRASMVRAAVAVSNVDAMFSRMRGSWCIACATIYASVPRTRTRVKTSMVTSNGLVHRANATRACRDAPERGCLWCRARVRHRSGTT